MEILLENLEVETRTYFFEKVIRDIACAVAEISEMETFLHSLPSEETLSSKNSNSSTPEVRKILNKSKTVKWFPRHKSSNHDRSECFSNQVKVSFTPRNPKQWKETPSTSSIEVRKKRFNYLV